MSGAARRAIRPVRGRRRALRLGALAAVGALLAFLQVSASTPAVAGPAGGAKKRCKVVVRKIHGKRRRVRICHKVKPKPLPPGARLLAAIPLGSGADPKELAVDENGVWVLDSFNGEVIRVDPASNAVVARIRTSPISFGSVAVGGGAVWNSSFAENGVLRIDEGTNQLAATMPFAEQDAGPWGVGYASGSVWVAMHHLGSVVRIDPATNSIVASIDISPAGVDGPAELAAGETGIWIRVYKTAEVVHVDPATNAVVGRVQESGPPILDGSSVWIERPFSVDLVDPVASRVVKKVALPQTLGNRGGYGAAGLGSVWIPTKSGLARVDESKKKLVGLLKGVPSGSFMAAVGSGSIWVTIPDRGLLLRYAPT